jgi:hypothetical protein
MMETELLEQTEETTNDGATLGHLFCGKCYPEEVGRKSFCGLEFDPKEDWVVPVGSFIADCVVCLDFEGCPKHPDI